MVDSCVNLLIIGDIPRIKDFLFRSGNKLLSGIKELLRSGNELFLSRKQLLRSGKELFRSGDELLRSGNELLQSGDELLQSGNELLSGINKLFQSGKGLFLLRGKWDTLLKYNGVIGTKLCSFIKLLQR